MLVDIFDLCLPRDQTVKSWTPQCWSWVSCSLWASSMMSVKAVAQRICAATGTLITALFEQLWVKSKGSPNMTFRPDELRLLVPLCSSTMLSRPLYRGKDCKLILGFDIGTTYSGISYRWDPVFSSLESVPLLILSQTSLLVPGQIPEIKGVTR